MKYIFYVFIVITLLSCELYENKRVVKINIPKAGKVIVTSKSDYQEFTLNCKESLYINIYKGEVYSISFYSMFGSVYSSYPSGNILDNMDSEVLLDSKLGLISLVLNQCNRFYIDVSLERINKVIKKIGEHQDPWICDIEDIKSYLLGNISLSSISKYKTHIIPELDFLRSMECENSIQSCWYKSITLFKCESKTYRVQVYENGTYCIL